VAFNKKRNLFISKNNDFNIRKNLLKTYIWSIMLYGCEIWTIAREEWKHSKCGATGGWKRKVGSIVTNEEVLERVSEKKSMWKSIQKKVK
jgi:hypothetical protein